MCYTLPISESRKTAEQIFLKQPLGAKKAAAEISQECEAKIFLQKNFLALD